MSGEEREAKTGRCFSDMVVDKRVDSEKGFLYCFKRASVRQAERERERGGTVNSVGSRPKGSSAATPAISSLLDLAISSGDFVVISTVGGTDPLLVASASGAARIANAHRCFNPCLQETLPLRRGSSRSSPPLACTYK
jgi:hypothetical protein